METKTKVSIKKKRVRIESDDFDQYLGVTHNGYQWQNVRADDATLRLIAATIEAHLREGKPPVLDLIKRAASGCPNCGGNCFSGIDAWDECPECWDYMRYIREVENG